MNITNQQKNRLREFALMKNKPLWYRDNIARQVKRGMTEKQAEELIDSLNVNMEEVVIGGGYRKDEV